MTEGAGVAARAMLDRLVTQPAWAAIRLRDSATVTLVGGSLSTVQRLADVPLEEGAPESGRRFDRLLAIPFRQVAERGFEVHDDGAPLAVVEIEQEEEVPLADLLAVLPDLPVEFEDRGGFESTDEDYATVVDRIIRDEIGNGEGANLVVGRHYRARLREWDADRALTVFRRLLEQERGAYWTFCFFTGDRFLVGASPERHVSVTGGPDLADVRMNPISGTFRLRRSRAGRAQGPAAGVPGRREGDLRALHGRRRGAEDDVRHLPRGRPGARAVPQADDAPRAHRVPPRRPHPVRRARRAARHHVRRHGHRVAGRERLPADQGVRVRGARLLRRRPRPDRPRRPGSPDRGQPDRDPQCRRLPGRRAPGDRRRDAGPRLRPRLRGGRDARQGRRHPQRLRPRARGVGGARERRRAHARRGRADRAGLAQPAALPLLADRPVRRRSVRGAQGPVGGRARRRGRLREHAEPRVLRARHDHDGGAPRGLPARRARRPRPGGRRSRARRPARRQSPQDRGVPARDRRPPGVRPAVPRGVPGPPGAVRPARDSPCLQGHRLPGHAVAGRPVRAPRAGRVLQHVRRPQRRPAARGRAGGRRPGDRRRPRARRSALPRASSSTPSRS